MYIHVTYLTMDQCIELSIHFLKRKLRGTGNALLAVAQSYVGHAKYVNQDLYKYTLHT